LGDLTRNTRPDVSKPRSSWNPGGRTELSNDLLAARAAAGDPLLWVAVVGTNQSVVPGNYGGLGGTGVALAVLDAQFVAHEITHVLLEPNHDKGTCPSVTPVDDSFRGSGYPTGTIGEWGWDYVKDKIMSPRETPAT
jgi:hypothetical protein